MAPWFKELMESHRLLAAAYRFSALRVLNLLGPFQRRWIGCLLGRIELLLGGRKASLRSPRGALASRINRPPMCHGMPTAQPALKSPLGGFARKKPGSRLVVAIHRAFSRISNPNSSSRESSVFNLKI
ncbi:MAG: hypothetical protein M2R46_00422 [Verrucomicrobia subdivision 3 bacterium]|nr:hypothetical protein [Limisphaerales bacterium]